MDLQEKFVTLLHGRDIDLHYYLDKKEIKDILISNFSFLEDPGKDAGLKIEYVSGKYSIETEPEKPKEGGAK